VLRVNPPRSDFGPPDSVQHRVTRAPAASARDVGTLASSFGRAMQSPRKRQQGRVEAPSAPTRTPATPGVLFRRAVVEADPMPSHMAFERHGVRRNGAGTRCRESLDAGSALCNSVIGSPSAELPGWPGDETATRGYRVVLPTCSLVPAWGMSKTPLANHRTHECAW
jgi:hypothetical protein